VYNHLPSKDHLFLQVVDEMLVSTAAEELVAYKPHSPIREQLKGLAHARLDLLRDPSYTDLARMAIAAAMSSRSIAQQLSLRLLARPECAITQWVCGAVNDQELTDCAPAYAAQQLTSLLKGVALWTQLALGQPILCLSERQLAVESSVDMFLARYAPSNDQPP